MQPYLFPYIGYFQTMSTAHKYVIYDDVHFIKAGWINRNNILVGGERRRFTVPLRGASQNKLINEIEIEGDLTKLKRTFATNYARAPYISQVGALLEQVLDFHDLNLARFVGHSIEVIAGHLGLECEISYSSSLPETQAFAGQERIIEICKSLGATRYVNAIGGRDLYKEEAFQSNCIELSFLQSGPRDYKQFANEFVPGLSIIDALMFNSRTEVIDMLDDYELV